MSTATDRVHTTTVLARSRWAVFGAALAVTLGAGGILTTSATLDSGERAVYVPITPCRLLDTRPAPDTVGGRTSPLGPAETYSVAVRGTNGSCTIPADAAGLAMNVAVIAPTDASYLAVFPSDAPLPLAANANWLANDPPLSNAVIADISADGRISFYNLKGTVHLAVDIVGYFVDHTHDDRYYTKAQTDSAVATKAIKPTGAATILVDPAEFRDTLESPSTWKHTAASGYIQGLNGVSCFTAPVVLPSGANVTGVRAWANDTVNGPEVSIRLSRNLFGLTVAPDSMAFVGTGGPATPNDILITDTTINFFTVNNATHTYFLYVCVGINTYFWGAAVDFTHPT